MRVALVTGSSRGLGRAIAERLARDGLAVAVNDRRGEGEPVAAAIRKAGSACAAFAADVTDAQAVTGLVDAIERRLAPVDVLVLNATGPQPNAPLAALGWREHLDQLEFFVKSPVLLGRAVLPGMRERGWGRIVQVDSEVVDRPPPGRSAYAVAKAAQIGQTRAWARELAYAAGAPPGRGLSRAMIGCRPPARESTTLNRTRSLTAAVTGGADSNAR